MIFRVLIFIFLFPSLAFGATYYVDDSGCSDNNAGTDSGSPWCHCPGMEDWSGSASLSPGDTVYFASNGKWEYDTSTSKFLVAVGGVTYIGDTWPTADTAVGHGSSCEDGGCAEFELTQNHSMYHRFIDIYYDDDAHETVFQGFELDANDYSITGIGINHQGLGPFSEMDGETKRIQNCYFHDEYHTSDSFWYGFIVGTGGYSESTSYNVENVEFINNSIINTSRDAYCLYAANDESSADNWDKYILFRNNKAYNINCRGEPCSSTKPSSYSAGSCFLFKNRSEEVTVEFNTCQYSNGSGIANSRDSSSHHTCGVNHVYRYNIIQDNCDGCSGSAAFGLKIKSGGTKSIEVYGNYFGDAARKPIGFTESLSGDLDVRFYNNIVYTDGGIAMSVCERDIGGGQCSSPNVTRFEVKNNIFYTDSGSLAYDDMYGYASGDDIDSNIYYNTGTNKAYSDGSYYTASTITNLDSNGLTDDPSFTGGTLPTSFTGTYGTDLVPNTTFFELDTGDPPVDAGTDIGGDPYYGAINFSGKSGSLNRDYNGGSAWDIGAYELYEESSPIFTIQGITISQKE